MRSTGWVLVALLLVACSSARDGDPCSSNDDCESHSCDGAICRGKSCSSSQDCEDSWSCVLLNVDPIFGLRAQNCQVDCVDGGCPQQYTCREDTCRYVGPSLHIVGAPQTPRAGELIQLTAVMTPDVSGSIFRWTHRYEMNPLSDPILARTIELVPDAGRYEITLTVDFEPVDGGLLREDMTLIVSP